MRENKNFRYGIKFQVKISSSNSRSNIVFRRKILFLQFKFVIVKKKTEQSPLSV